MEVFIYHGSCLLRAYTVGFVTFTRSLKFIGGRVVSHYFDYAESNGAKIFEIKKYLGVANRSQNFQVLTKNVEISISFIHTSE